MSTLSITNITINKFSAVDSKELKNIVDLMIKYGIKNPLNLLPQTPWYEVSFRLNNTYTGFANGIRRILLEEIPTKCLDFDYNNHYETDDEFILIDKIQKDINLLPINQDIDDNKFDNYSIDLHVYNDTNEIVEIKAYDIRITNKSKNKINRDNSGKVLHDIKQKNELYSYRRMSYEKNNQIINEDPILINKLIPDSNITITSLRPGKYIIIKNISIIEGLCKDNAAKFSLLNEVKYKPIVKSIFNSFNNEGTRSIEQNPTTFDISFTTASNISVNNVINKLCNVLKNKLLITKEKIENYNNLENKLSYYSANNLEVSFKDNMFVYKIHGEYLTISKMLAQRCYLLDKNISFCVSTVDRFDNEIAIIKLKHPDPNKLLIASCEECIKDVEKLRKSLVK